MKFQFPPENQGFTYLQTNRSDDLGSLWSTFNLDFQSNLGAMRLAQKLVTNTTSSDDAQLGTPGAFEYFDNRWFSICNTCVFKNTDPNLTDGFVEDASTGAQTNYNFIYSDLAVFNDRLWSTTATTLYSKASGSGTGTWTSRDTLATNVVHKLAYLKKFNRLYFTDTITAVSSINTSDVVANSTGDYFIDLGTTTGQITTMVATSTDIFIGTGINQTSTAIDSFYGAILQWDGISAQPTAEYRLNAGACLAMTVYESVPYAIDSEGVVLKFTGYSFEEIGRLPINRNLLVGATFPVTTGRFVHFNGMTATKNNTLLIAVNNLQWDPSQTITENLPSGIWELDLGTGNFTHKYSFTLKSLASSTITDYGQNRISAIGAIKINPLNMSTITTTPGRSLILAGSSYYTDASSTKSAIFIDSPDKPTTDTEGQKRGYFVTTWFNSQEIADKWIRSWLTFRRFLNSDDKIILKYRLNEEDPVEATITWTSTTTFTTTTDVSAYAPTANPFNGTTGGEVEVIQGTGSGSCTHISSISEAGGTYTVTLDTAVTGVTGTAKARFQKWIKMFPEVTGQVNSYAQIAIGSLADIQCQIKGVLEWTGDDEFYKMIVVSNEDIKANP